jgi:hypothetical protein
MMIAVLASLICLLSAGLLAVYGPRWLLSAPRVSYRGRFADAQRSFLREAKEKGCTGCPDL